MQQDRVDALFSPLEKEHAKHSQEIEELKFLFKNCCYNQNMLIEEMNRSRAGFNFPDRETLKKTANSMGIKPGMSFELRIPMTFWNDMLLFEFHAFVSNIIRCCNSLTKFKIKNVDKIQDIWGVSIAKYYFCKLDKKIKDRGDLHVFLRAQFEDWIKEVNKERNVIIHDYIENKMQGYLVFIYERQSEDFIKTEGNIMLSILEPNVKNVEKNVSEILGKLESFIKEFFKIYKPS